LPRKTGNLYVEHATVVKSMGVRDEAIADIEIKLIATDKALESDFYRIENTSI
jgi:hypothetical protein